jgi:hypothetical protein
LIAINPERSERVRSPFDRIGSFDTLRVVAKGLDSVRGEPVEPWTESSFDDLFGKAGDRPAN